MQTTGWDVVMNDCIGLLTWIKYDFLANPSSWLTFGSTAILGLLTTYFAWRTKQSEWKQLLQVNRAFDDELRTAHDNLENAHIFTSMLLAVMDSSVEARLSTFREYEQEPRYGNIPAVTNILSFHMPREVKEAQSALLQVLAVRFKLKNLIAYGSPADEIGTTMTAVAKMTQEADEKLKRVLERIEKRRRDLARGI